MNHVKGGIKKGLFIALAVLSLLTDFRYSRGEPSHEKMEAGTGSEESALYGVPEFKGESSGPVLLRYKFKPEEHLKINMNMAMSQQIFINDQRIRVRTFMTLEGNCKIKSIEKDGAANASITLTRVIIDTKGPSSAAFDSASGSGAENPAFKGILSLINSPVPIRISSIGEVLYMDKPALEGMIKRSGDAADTFDLKNIFDEFLANAFIQLSWVPVRRGDTYDAGLITRALPDGGEIVAKTVYRVLAVSGDRDRTVLQPEGKFSVNSPPEGEMKLRLNSGRMGGWVLFDLKKGAIVRSRRTSRMDMTLSESDRFMRMKTEVRQSTSVQ